MRCFPKRMSACRDGARWEGGGELSDNALQNLVDNGQQDALIVVLAKLPVNGGEHLG